MDRLARNLTDLRLLVKSLTDRGVVVQFVKESLTFTGEDSPMANLLLSMLGAVAEFERALILERQREGIAKAQREGRYKGRVPTARRKTAEIIRLKEAGIRPTEIASRLGIGRASVYRVLSAGASGDRREAA